MLSMTNHKDAGLLGPHDQLCTGQSTLIVVPARTRYLHLLHIQHLSIPRPYSLVTSTSDLRAWESTTTCVTQVALSPNPPSRCSLVEIDDAAMQSPLYTYFHLCPSLSLKLKLFCFAERDFRHQLHISCDMRWQYQSFSFCMCSHRLRHGQWKMWWCWLFLASLSESTPKLSRMVDVNQCSKLLQ